MITVLLVDDQQLVGAAVGRMLRTEKDIEYHFCNDPTEALATAQRLRPHVILQDLVMPKLSGIELIQRYREDPETRDIPV